MIIKKILILFIITLTLIGIPSAICRPIDNMAVNGNPKEDVFNVFKNNNINTNGIEFIDEMYSYGIKDWDNVLINNNVNGVVVGFVMCNKRGVYINETYSRNKHVIMHEYLHTITRNVICNDSNITIAYEQITECLADRFFKADKLLYGADETCKLLKEKFTTQQLFNFYINLNYDKIKSLTQ